MSAWRPGRSVITPNDVIAWQIWKKARKLEQQRERRANLRRIDYYPSREALEVILDQTHGACGGDFSSVLNRIVEAWAEFPEIPPPG